MFPHILHWPKGNYFLQCRYASLMACHPCLAFLLSPHGTFGMRTLVRLLGNMNEHEYYPCVYRVIPSLRTLCIIYHGALIKISLLKFLCSAQRGRRSQPTSLKKFIKHHQGNKSLPGGHMVGEAILNLHQAVVRIVSRHQEKTCGPFEGQRRPLRMILHNLFPLGNGNGVFLK